MLIYMSENQIPFSQVSIETLYIEENKSSHFRPIRDSIRIYGPILKKSQGFRFILSGIVCTIIDLAIYQLMLFLLAAIENLWLLNLLANVIARVVSALLNYYINLKYVFRKNTSSKQDFIKYSIVVVLRLLLSWVIQTPIFTALGIEGVLRGLVKCIIDLLLTLASYTVQKKWVFVKK